MKTKVKVPRLVNNFVNVFRPEPQVYPGASGNELCHGQWYDEWVPNDHTFTMGPDGNWHIFGITHPLTTAANIHEGEDQLFHAVAPGNIFDKPLSPKCFRDCGTVLPPSERPGEPNPIYAPFIIKIEKLYHIVYGPYAIRHRVSEDLVNWRECPPMFVEPSQQGTRDPHILFHDGKYYLTYCAFNEVRQRVSTDMTNWSDYRIIRVAPTEIAAPESPFIVYHDEMFYLIFCLWSGVWDQKTVAQAYPHITEVHASPTIDGFMDTEPIATFDAHASEVFQVGKRYFLSSAEWPERGINVVEMVFE